MIIATVQIRHTSAETICCQALPVGAVGLQVAFEFADSAWLDLSKTVVFRNNSMVMDAALIDGCAVIPHELLNKVADPIYVGIYGTDSNNNLAIPTVWAKLGNISSASIPSDTLSSEATLPYWAQIQEQVEYLRLKVNQIQSSSGSQTPDDGTGSSVSLLYASVMYQEGDSGTVIPTGVWCTDIPAVAPGKFLWTRILQQFSTGDPIIAYSVSRMGTDALISVCNTFPDDSGNIVLTASDIGALSVNGGILSGPVDMNGQKLSGLNMPVEDDEAATKGYALAKDHVVNSFSVTQAGYAADARALKTLKELIDAGMSTDLLWENASPDSNFATQDISLNMAAYSHLLIEFVSGVASLVIAKSKTYYANHLNVTSTASNATVIELRRRAANFNDTKINFTDCNATMYTTTSGKFNATDTNNAAIKPYRIFGLKGIE